MALTVTMTHVQAQLDAASTAIASGDYATAISHAERGLALAAAIPDGGKANAEIRLARDAMTSLIASCRRSQASAAGIQRTAITYVRPTS